jgi:hypothetical protein
MPDPSAEPAPSSDAVELAATFAAGLSLAIFAAVNLVPLLVGRELECFPDLKEALKVLVGIGLAAFFAAAGVGLVPAYRVVIKKGPATFTRLGGPVGAALIFILLALPTFSDPVRLVMGMSTGTLCVPTGLLGANPEQWRAFSRSMGYRAEN